MRFLIRRSYGPNSDYLKDFDERWGTSWSEMFSSAKRFRTKKDAVQAINDVMDLHKVLMPANMPDFSAYDVVQI